MSRCKKLAGKRTGDDVVEEINMWLRQVTEHLHSHYYPDYAVINVDEARITDKKGDFSSIKRIESGDRERHNVLYVRGGVTASIVPFVSADGTCNCSFYILPVAAGFKTSDLSADLKDEEGVAMDVDEEEMTTAEANADFFIRKAHVRESRENGHPRFFVFTKSGCVNNEV